jgi:hypothetical protein
MYPPSEGDYSSPEPAAAHYQPYDNYGYVREEYSAPDSTIAEEAPVPYHREYAIPTGNYAAPASEVFGHHDWAKQRSSGHDPAEQFGQRQVGQAVVSARHSPA